MVSGRKKLREAATAKFGEEQGKTVAGNSAEMSSFFKNLDNADENINGDNATVIPKGSSQPIALKKVNGEWKVDASTMAKGSSLFEKMAKAANETADEINAGKYKSAAEANSAFSDKMMGSLFPGKSLLNQIKAHQPRPGSNPLDNEP
jgi:hypothetical protein